MSGTKKPAKGGDARPVRRPPARVVPAARRPGKKLSAPLDG